MIVSASYRTDIPAFYGDWFLRRLDAGWCMVANPYGGAPYRVSLLPEDVDGFVFWTRNPAPFAAALEAVAGRGVPFVVQFTITGYPRLLEAAVPDWRRAAGHAQDLAARYGGRSVVWRYDPILISDRTPEDWHRAGFAALAARMAGAIDEVVVSFAQIYRKTARNLGAVAARHGIAWHDPDAAVKRRLIADLSGIAADHGMTLTLCTQPALDGAAPPARCVDAARLADIAGRALRVRTRGNRPGCLCAESRDIGAYDTCPHGCAYCYAVADHGRARAARRAHDPEAAMLAPAAGHRPLSHRS